MMKTMLPRMLALAGALMLAHAPAAAAPRDLEAPVLGRAGDSAVGTAAMELDLGPRIGLTGSTQPRTIGVRLWYPAQAGSGPAAIYRHIARFAEGGELAIAEQGVARENAVPAGEAVPLVLLSHGYRGWSAHLSRLGEHLAWRGYVVAALDHRDAPFDSPAAFALSFGQVLIDRARDQREALARLLAMRSDKASPLSRVDATRVGLIGYSMGGYGALATAGADYDPASKVYAPMPDAGRATLASDTATAAKVKALVLFAPWGAAPDNRVWQGSALAKVRAPTLMIAGDQDDIVDYRGGIRWLFDSLSGADRRLLVYREARHNVAGNPVELKPDAPFAAVDAFHEPVWRMERINAINQHFVTAFLDLHLKGDSAKAAYLNVATPIAGDGAWPGAFGQQWGGKTASEDQPGYWRGFQRRWALGLELHHRPVGPAKQ
jgi:predicted dienelactone hydrolase